MSNLGEQKCKSMLTNVMKGINHILSYIGTLLVILYMKMSK